MRKESKGAVPIKFAQTASEHLFTFFRLSLKFNVRMRKAHTAHAWSQKGALRPGNIKSHSLLCRIQCGKKGIALLSAAQEVDRATSRLVWCPDPSQLYKRTR